MPMEDKSPKPGQFRPLLPKSEPNLQPPRGSFGSGDADTRKPRNTPNACDVCRKRKSKCDGQPNCQACVRRGTSCTYAVRRQPDSRNETEGQQENREMLRQLRTLPYDHAHDLLNQIRRNPDIYSDLDASGLPPQVRDQILYRNILLPPQDSLEYELMIRNPIAYPNLLPVRLTASPLQEMLRPRKLVPTPRQQAATPSSNQQLAASSPATTAAGSSTRHMSIDSSQPSPSPLGGPSSARPLVDYRLHHVNIVNWTSVPITNDLASRVISFYLEIDYPVLPVFDADPFLDDLVGHKTDFCSCFLVSALLGCACQSYTAFESDSAQLSLSFFAEAETLWNRRSGCPDSLPTASALQLLSLAASLRGNDHVAKQYLHEGVRVTERMGLFNNEIEPMTDEPWPGGSTRWGSAASYTSWGIYACVSLHALHYHDVEIVTMPRLPTPGQMKLVEGIEDDEPPKVGYDLRVVDALCALWVIFHDIAQHYYAANDAQSMIHASTAFAEETYTKLWDWASSLPLDLARGDQNSHAVVMMHTFFHAIATDLFRPLLFGPWRQHKLQLFNSPQGTPESVYAASTKQLKRLLLVYRLGFKAATLSGLWHTMLIHVANAALGDGAINPTTPLMTDDSGSSGNSGNSSLGAGSSRTGKGAVASSGAGTSTGNTEWRFYLGACLAALGDLHVAFRASGALAQSILGMALQQTSFGIDEAQRTAATLAELGRLHQTATGTGTTAVRTSGGERWVVDLALATKDREGACCSALVEVFREVMLFQEFTTGDM